MQKAAPKARLSKQKAGDLEAQDQMTANAYQHDEGIRIVRVKVWSDLGVLGLYVSGHPLDKHRELLSKQKMPIARAKESFPKGTETIITGYLDEVKSLLTKKGDKMAFIKISDYTGSVEAVVFPKAFEVYGSMLVPGTCVMLKGEFNSRNGDTSFVAERVKKL